MQKVPFSQQLMFGNLQYAFSRHDSTKESSKTQKELTGLHQHSFLPQPAIDKWSEEICSVETSLRHIQLHIVQLGIDMFGNGEAPRKSIPGTIPMPVPYFNLFSTNTLVKKALLHE
uniref:Uncharacterized protein n=1 Tax=Oryza brachyantha TaxID=4533 RepID=J3N9H5_ORYBR